MNIIDLAKNTSAAFYKRGTKIPLLPDIGDFSWNWSTVMDTGVDILYSLSEKHFIGTVSLTLSKASGVRDVMVLCDSLCSGRYHAETGKSINGTIDIPVGVSANEVTIRLNACLLEISIEELCIYGTNVSEIQLYPTPENVKFGNGSVKLYDLSDILSDFSDSDTAFAAKHLKERISEYYDIPMNGTVSIEISKSSSIPDDGYMLSVGFERILIKASNRRGLLYGCEALFILIKDGEIPICEISDKPYKKLRGFHFFLPPRENIEFCKRVLKYILLPMRYNILFIEFCGGMRFDKHPEISEAWLQGNKAAKAGLQPEFPHGRVADGQLLEKSEVSDLIEYARSLGFEIVPEVQSLSHVQYITYAHPDIAEISDEVRNDIKDTRAADQPPDVFYHHSYCPQNEKSYEIIYDIIDEIIEVAKPERYVHMGHDEVYQIGICPKCKGKDPAELLALHINRMYDYVTKKGYKMAMWSDMLQPTETHYGTSPAIDMIPKDILMLDFIWYFHFDLDMEDHILPHGFEVIAGNLYSSHYPRYESRIAKPNMLGGEVSTWCIFKEYLLAKNGKFFDILYTAEMLWSKKYNSKARPIYTNIVSKIIPIVRDEIRGIIIPKSKKLLYTPIKLNANCTELPSVIRKAASSYSGNDFDASSAIIADNETVGVGDKYDRIVFLHTTLSNEKRDAWKNLEKIGAYKVVYDDGTVEDIPIEYAGNICVWSHRYGEPMPQQYYRHQGYIATYWSDPVIAAKSEYGDDITVLGFNWINPHPEKQIDSIICTGEKNTDAKIAILGISGVKIL